MTDRYLFRGKRIEDGEWVIGHLAVWSCGRSEIWGHEKNNELYRFIIDPATVGQCTGLKDKNGRLTFEGDVVKVDLDWPPGGENSRDGVEREVIFHKGIYSITSKPFIENMSHRPLCECYNSEIIGNIYDNPELLSEVAL